MQRIDETAVDPQSIDLNLLLVLRALLAERSVTRAAHRLGLSQSATSHALNRLRAAFDDPLMQRRGAAMVPTPLAERLSPLLDDALEGLDAVLMQTKRFDPSRTRRVFTIACPDFAIPDLVPVMNALLEEAPLAAISFRSMNDVVERLQRGEVDLAAAPIPRRRTGIRQRLWMELELAVFVRAGHPAVEGWGPEAWSAGRHVRVELPAEREGPVERAADAAGIGRAVGAVVPSFSDVAPLLSSSDLMAAAPARALAADVERYSLVQLPLPVPAEPTLLSLATPTTSSSSPAVTWFWELALRALDLDG